MKGILCKSISKDQTDRFDKFFENHLVWAPEQYYAEIVKRIMVGILLMFFALPYKSSDGEIIMEGYLLVVILVLEYEAVWFYMRRYMVYTYEKKERKIWEILKYMPVSKKDLFSYRLQKLFNFVIKFSAAVFVIQLLISLTFVPEHLLLNMAYVLLMGFVAPMVEGFLVCLYK